MIYSDYDVEVFAQLGIMLLDEYGEPVSVISILYDLADAFEKANDYKPLQAHVWNLIRLVMRREGL